MSLASITSLSVTDIQKAFSEDGILYVEDATIGDRVKEIQMKRFPFESAEGLDFCRMNVLEDIVRTLLSVWVPPDIHPAHSLRSRGSAAVVRPWNLRSVPNRCKLHLRLHDRTELRVKGCCRSAVEPTIMHDSLRRFAITPNQRLYCIQWLIGNTLCAS